MALTKTDVSALYVAIFNRASEGEGNTFWQTAGTSAEVANAMLETAPAKEYFGAALDDDQAFVEHIYLNTLGKTVADDAEGIEFWTGELATQSRGEVIARLIESALDAATAGPAQDKFKNMIAVSDFAADTLEDAPADLGVLRFDAGLEGVTADPASVDAAKQAVDEILNPVDPVVKALNNLEAANDAVEKFLKDAAELDFVETEDAKKATDGEISAAVTTAESVVASNVTGYDADDTAARKEAAISYQQDLNDIQLAEANTALQDAVDAIVEAGAAEVLLKLSAANNANTEAAEAVPGAVAAADAELAKFTTLYANAPSEFDDLFEEGTNGRLQLQDGVTEQAYPGVTVVLNAYQNRLDVEATATAAAEAFQAALIESLYIDSLILDKEDINAVFSTPVEDASTLTQAQVQAELNTLFAEAQTAAGVALERDDAGLITSNIGEEEVDAYNALREAVNAFEGQSALGIPGELAINQLLATSAVERAETAITNLNAALADLQEAQALAAELESLEEVVTAAEEAFEDLGVEVKTLSTTSQTVGTAGDDVFLVGEGGTVVSFGLQGEDSIYVGSEFSLVALTGNQTIGSNVGDTAALEVFAKQSGLNVDLYVEQKPFAGNGSSEADLIKVTLAGVSVDDLVLEDGFLSIA